MSENGSEKTPVPHVALTAVEDTKAGRHNLPKEGPLNISDKLKEQLVAGAKIRTGEQ